MTAPAEKPDAKEAYERWREGGAGGPCATANASPTAIAKAAMHRVLRAIRESCERDRNLLTRAEKDEENGRLLNDVIVETARALWALGEQP